MGPSPIVRALLVFFSMITASASTFAQSTQPAPDNSASIQALRQEIYQLRKELETRVSALEAAIAALEGRPPAATGDLSPPQPVAEVPPGAAGAGGPTGALPVYGAGTASSKIFNPDIAVIGNFLGATGSNAVDPGPVLEMPESEASLQAIVDPYARADFFLAFGEEGVDLEEGFITFPTLPAGLLMKVGKLRQAFGKVNTLHSHMIPWTDRPLVTGNLVGGEEGIADAGISIARLISNPWVFLEVTGEVFRGDGGDVFTSSTRSDLSYGARVRGYHDLSESTNVDVGFSLAHGHNDSGVVDDVDVGRFTTNLFGLDATVRWRPLQRAIYRSFLGRSEIIWSRREQPETDQNAWGFYISGDYQLGRRWFTGFRIDESDRAEDSTLRDKGQSLLLTYWPSEFSQVRGQYRRTRREDAPTANEFLFQVQFSIGAHGAHPF